MGAFAQIRYKILLLNNKNSALFGVVSLASFGL